MTILVVQKEWRTGMNGYVTFYEQHRVEVYADNAVEAQAEALKVFSSKYPPPQNQVVAYRCCIGGAQWRTA